jgi:hypothetical protein
MAQAAPDGKQVVSPELRADLKQFMEFRHVFRQGYSFQFKWEKMEPLVMSCGEVFIRLKSALAEFIGNK